MLINTYSHVATTFKSREDHIKQLELNEACKVELAPTEVDEDGQKINPHIPQYMSFAPWYLNVEKKYYLLWNDQSRIFQEDDYPLSVANMSEYAIKKTRGAFIAAVLAMQGFGILVAGKIWLLAYYAEDNGGKSGWGRWRHCKLLHSIGPLHYVNKTGIILKDFQSFI
ncbi:Pre-mRNA-splicing factor SLU7 [Sesbania bispinosa]|nr:Pre-mRNA-splicing factor SLU7 [Sesbania bispinosa]